MVAESLNLYELLPYSELVPTYIAPLCQDGSIFQPICSGIVSFMMGPDSEQFNNVRFKVSTTVCRISYLQNLDLYPKLQSLTTTVKEKHLILL